MSNYSKSLLPFEPIQAWLENRGWSLSGINEQSDGTHSYLFWHETDKGALHVNPQRRQVNATTVDFVGISSVTPLLDNLPGIIVAEPKTLPRSANTVKKVGRAILRLYTEHWEDIGGVSYTPESVERIQAAVRDAQERVKVIAETIDPYAGALRERAHDPYKVRARLPGGARVVVNAQARFSPCADPKRQLNLCQAEDPVLTFDTEGASLDACLRLIRNGGSWTKDQLRLESLDFAIGEPVKFDPAEEAEFETSVEGVGFNWRGIGMLVFLKSKRGRWSFCIADKTGSRIFADEHENVFDLMVAFIRFINERPVGGLALALDPVMGALVEMADAEGSMPDDVESPADVEALFESMGQKLEVARGDAAEREVLV